MLGLRFCTRAFSSCGKRGPLFIAVRGPLTIVASLVAEHRLQTRRLSSCGSWAQLLRSMWDPPRPGLEPVSPAIAGRLPTTAPPGKPGNTFISILGRCISQFSFLAHFRPLSDMDHLILQPNALDSRGAWPTPLTPSLNQQCLQGKTLPVHLEKDFWSPEH